MEGPSSSDGFDRCPARVCVCVKSEERARERKVSLLATDGAGWRERSRLVLSGGLNQGPSEGGDGPGLS